MNRKPASRKLQIDTASVFAPLLAPARYKGAFGGRGSGKSHFFAGLMLEDALRAPGDWGEGLRGLCVREIQKSLKQSAKKLLEDKLAQYGLGEADGFKIYESVIRTPRDGILDFQGMRDHTADSIKSYEGFHRAWVEEGHTLSRASLTLLRPTIRWEDKRLGAASEIWAGWNPRRKTDPVDALFRRKRPTGALCVSANWRDNPWFPDVLEAERLDCLRDAPDQYDHIWQGGYVTASESAYYAHALATTRAENRITDKLSADPLMQIRAFWDIGGTGAKADATAIWIAQFVGREIRVLDYYEAIGQPLSAHVNWLRENGYGAALCVLPHDGATKDRVHDVSFESALREAGFEVQIIANQGKGAARLRIEAARRLFPSIWFHAGKCAGGLDALGWYHEKKDETRDIGLGPEHDWSSHAADAFGLLCVAYDAPQDRPASDPRGNIRTGAWMA